MHTPSDDRQFIIVANVSGAHGIKGWVKLRSYLEEPHTIMEYADTLSIQFNEEWHAINIDQARHHHRQFIIHIVGCDDRDSAQGYQNSALALRSSALPALPSGQFYWHQIKGLDVYHIDQCDEQIGTVHDIMATGANDVLVVTNTQEEKQPKERLIPYLPERVVREIDLSNNRIVVDWPMDF